MCGFLIKVCSFNHLIENLLVVFLFLESAWSDTFNFWFFWILGHCTLCNIWSSVVYIAPGTLLVVPIIVTDPHPFYLSDWGYEFFRSLFLVSSRLPINHPLPLRRFQPRFFGDALAWHISINPCSLRSLLFLRFSGALVLLIISRPDM